MTKIKKKKEEQKKENKNKKNRKKRGTSEKEEKEKNKKKKREKKPIKAQNLLEEKNKLERTFTLAVPGIPILRAGDLVKIEKNATGITGVFEVKSVNHNFSQKYSLAGINIYFMSLTLEYVEGIKDE
jgi:PREDICTED: ras homolog enriched in brain like 1-like, partial